MKLTRRSLLQSTAAAAAVSRASLGQHRNLFTGDSCVYFYNPEIYHPEGLPYTAKAIHRYVDRLADSGIDTFLSNPNAQVAWYPSKKLPTVIDGYKRGDKEFFRGHAAAARVTADQMESYLVKTAKFFDLYLDLQEAGVDWLAETTKACRRRKISPWLSIRMNDMHGALNPTGSNFNCPLFRQEKYRLRGSTMTPDSEPYLYWAGLNYELPEVRDYMMSQVRECVVDYDFEGLELDWLRNPHCCEPVAGKRQIALIAEWISGIRKLTQSRGKAYPLGLRVPANLAYMKNCGLDIKLLAREGLVDFVNFSNFWQTSWDIPYDALRRELGPHVAIYGVIEDAPNWVDGYSPRLGTNGPRYLSASAELLRGNAANKLSMGCDGIESFNFFCTDQPTIPGMMGNYDALKGLESLEKLRGQTKHYSLSSARGYVSDLWETPPQVPVTLEPKSFRAFHLSMCREPEGSKLTLQLVFAKQPGIPPIGARLNGGWAVFERTATRALLFPTGPYSEHAPANEAFNYVLRADDVQEGWNEISLVVRGGAPARLVSLELGVSR